MVRSLTYCLSIVFIGFFCSSCQKNYSYYKLDLSFKSKETLAEQLIQGSRYNFQGNSAYMENLFESMKLDQSSASLYQKLGDPYRKRGFPKEFHEYYSESVQLDPKISQGERGYIYLYFYRDYERALIDFDATDIHTPNYVDYPQSRSVDYLRGICYYQLNQPRLTIAYIDKHVALEDSTIGRDFMDSEPFLLRGKAYESIDKFDQALGNYEEALRLDSNVAGILYHLANIQYTLGNTEKSKKYLDNAENSLNEGIIFRRSYVDEFFRLYQSDVDDLRQKLDKY